MSDAPTAVLGPGSRPPQPNRPNVGPYRILSTIAQGGMGIIYRVVDPKRGREVALKMLIGGAWTDEETRRRFLREARILSDFSHPGIVSVYDVGVEEGIPYYTMEIVQGEMLTGHMQTWKPPLAQKLRIFLMCCEAVQYAHRKGVIHRDLKPANILMTQDHRPVLLDFGIAHLSESDIGTEMTLTGMAMGTPSYMSPEQAQGKSREVDVRSDIYSLGVILYELVSGRLPFQGSDSYALLKAVIEQEAPLPSSLMPGLSPDLEAVILKAIRKDPDQRYPAVSALAEDIRRYLDGRPVQALPDTTGYRLRKWVLRHKELAFSATGALLVAVFLGVWSFRSVYRGSLDAKAATEEARRALLAARTEQDRAEQDRRTAQEERDKALASGKAAIEALQQLREERGRHEVDVQLQQRRVRAEHLLEVAERARGPGDALQACDQALEADSSCVRAWQLRGGFLQALGKREESLQAFEKVLALDPGHAQAQERRGDVLLSLGKREEALQAFEKALQIDPAYTPAHLGRARVLQAQGMLEESLKAYDRTIAIDSALVQAHVERALLLKGQGKAEEALKGLERGIQLDPRNLELQEIRAGLLLDRGLLDEALKAFDHLLEMDPVRASAHLGRGRILEGKGKPAEALKAFDRALELDPRCVQAHLQRGLVQKARGRLEEALKSFDNVIGLDERQAQAHAGRGAILLSQGKSDAALQALDRAIALDATQPYPFFLRGKALQSGKKLEEAAVAYRKAIDLGLPPGVDLDICKARLEEILRKR